MAALQETPKDNNSRPELALVHLTLAQAAMPGAVRQTTAKDGLPEARLQLADTKHDTLQR
jgi:hypothetical protein